MATPFCRNAQPAVFSLGGDVSRLTGFPPILDAGVETLVLGSFPSPDSLARQAYYARPQNQFWRIMAALTGEPLVDMPYAGKTEALLRHHIGVWDVYRHCRREGALDSAIEAAEPNDFSSLASQAPQLKRACFNGRTAAKFERHFASRGYATHVLPSTSPAYAAMNFEGKLAAWQRAFTSGAI